MTDLDVVANLGTGIDDGRRLNLDTRVGVKQLGARRLHRALGPRLRGLPVSAGLGRMIAHERLARRSRLTDLHRRTAISEG